MCGSRLGPRHKHLIEPASRRLTCSCDACALLFYRNGETKYKSMPRDTLLLRDFHLSSDQWDSLLIPIGLAFFVKSSAEARTMAFYPSPAGTTEATPSADAWEDIVAGNLALSTMECDVEALLVNRLNDPPEYYLAPIDRCYELVGLIRASWRGLSGGDQVWSNIRQFFTELRESAHA